MAIKTVIESVGGGCLIAEKNKGGRALGVGRARRWHSARDSFKHIGRGDICKPTDTARKAVTVRLLKSIATERFIINKKPLMIILYWWRFLEGVNIFGRGQNKKPQRAFFGRSGAYVKFW